jgi:hypothetical protein
LILNSHGDIGVQIDDEENADRSLIVVGGGLRILQSELSSPPLPQPEPVLAPDTRAGKQRIRRRRSGS